MKVPIKNPKLHRKCPCGSKKKYRNCCFKLGVKPDQKFIHPDKKIIEQKLAQHRISEQYHVAHFGHVSEIKSCIFNGKRHVLLGGSIITADDPNKEWQTPMDFLISHLKTTLGNEWFDAQFNLPEKERHIIATWLLDSKSTIHDPAQPLKSLQLNGSAFSVAHLAYDLFVINNHGCLADKKIADRLIADLKKIANFNGARYEIFVFATLIRAGFELKLHDQLSGTTGRVAECVAIHKQTKVLLQIEAKTRNVRGVLGALEGQRKNIRLYDKLRDAIEKDVADPYVVFMDINLPKLSLDEKNKELDKIRNEYRKLEEKFPQKLPNIICFTNIPYHYKSDDLLGMKSTFGLIQSKFPRVALENELEIVNAINVALNQHGFLPSSFNESELYAANQESVSICSNINGGPSHVLDAEKGSG